MNAIPIIKRKDTTAYLWICPVCKGYVIKDDADAIPDLETLKQHNAERSINNKPQCIIRKPVLLLPHYWLPSPTGSKITTSINKSIEQPLLEPIVNDFIWKICLTLPPE